MPTLITKEQLERCMPGCKEAALWAPLLDMRLFENGIVEPRKIAHFLSQTGHESLNYNVVQENLNYSADGLKAHFGKYFRDVDVNLYARKPEKIANRVYANRMDNGSEASGDGWRFRGRGLIQVTGRYNYGVCSEYMYNDKQALLEDPDKLIEKDNALKSALWYWDYKKLKKYDTVEQITSLINGGSNGLADRRDRFERALKVLSV